MRLALYEPDIPQNAGALMRLAACLRVPVDVIEPCGFVFGDGKLRRAGMDYLDRLDLTRHSSWPPFHEGLGRQGGRLVLLTTKGSLPYTDFAFESDDVLMVGRESAGVPDAVHGAAFARLCIPMAPGMRSLNVAVSAAMVLGEALRQTGGLIGPDPNSP